MFSKVGQWVNSFKLCHFGSVTPLIIQCYFCAWLYSTLFQRTELQFKVNKLCVFSFSHQALRKLKTVCIRVAAGPCLIEACTAALVSHFLLGLPWVWGFILGWVQSPQRFYLVYTLHVFNSSMRLFKKIKQFTLSPSQLCAGCCVSSSGSSLHAAAAERWIWCGAGHPHPADGCWKLWRYSRHHRVHHMLGHGLRHR